MNTPLPVPQARTGDPDTSHEAAASVTNQTATHGRIMYLLERYGPLTDQRIREIWDYNPRGYPRGWDLVSESGLRTRRNELVKAGLVVDTGERVKLASGRRAVVWGVA